MLALPDVPAVLGHYFDLAEYIVFRTSLLILFGLALWRMIDKDRKKR
jgi:hypothetical protein